MTYRTCSFPLAFLRYLIFSDIYKLDFKIIRKYSGKCGIFTITRAKIGIISIFIYINKGN